MSMAGTLTRLRAGNGAQHSQAGSAGHWCHSRQTTSDRQQQAGSSAVFRRGALPSGGRHCVVSGHPVLAAGKGLNTSARGKSLQAVSEASITVKDEGAVEYSDSTKILCEFTCQTLFNFLSCTAAATAGTLAAGNAIHQTLMVMGAHMVILPLILFSFASVSSAHFNPMITASLVAAGQLPAKLGLGYVAAQLAGGVLGAFASFISLPANMRTAAMIGIHSVPPGHTIAQAFVGELFASFFFMSVLFGCLLDKRGWGKLGPLCVPLAITLSMWLVGPISSSCINPARAFGPAVVTGMWDHHWVWWTAPLIGGSAASVLYSKFFLPKSQQPQPFK